MAFPLSDFESVLRHPKMTIHYLDPPQPNPRVIAAKITDQITADDMKGLVDRLEEMVDRDEQALLLIDMQDYEGFEFSVILEKFKHLTLLWRSIERYAVIGAAHWMEVWVKMIDPITPMKIRAFSPENREEAWEWIFALKDHPEDGTRR